MLIKTEQREYLLCQNTCKGLFNITILSSSLIYLVQVGASKLSLSVHYMNTYNQWRSFREIHGRASLIIFCVLNLTILLHVGINQYFLFPAVTRAEDILIIYGCSQIAAVRPVLHAQTCWDSLALWLWVIGRRFSLLCRCCSAALPRSSLFSFSKPSFLASRAPWLRHAR
jgi:hypothetical protein